MADSRLAFDIVARGGSSAAAEFEKVAAASDHAGNAMKKNSKISTDAAKASVALTKARAAESNALDKVQVAESKLSNARQTAKDRTSQVQAAEARLLQVRKDTSSSTSMIAAAESKLASARSASRNSTTQVLAGEKALSKARREAAAAGDVAQKAAKDLSTVLDAEGKKASKGFLGGLKSVGPKVGGVLKSWFFNGGNDTSIFKQAGQNAGNGFFGALAGVLKTPVLGPIVAVSLLAAVEAVAAPAGAVLAGGVVAGFGAGIGALGVVFAAKSAVIKSIWSKTAHDLGAQMRTISKPFESTLSAMSVVAQRTFAGLKPELAGAFKTLGPAVAGFGDKLGQAFQKIGPALQPLAGAFKAVLGALGPGLNNAFAIVSSGLTKLSASISKSPTALADFARGIGGLVGDILRFLTIMNDADAAFKRWTGGVSGVTALMWVLRGAVAVVLVPLEAMAKALAFIGDRMNWVAGKLGIGTQVMDQSGAAAQAEASSLAQAAAAHLAHANAAAHSAHATHQANAAAIMLAGTYDRQAAATDKVISSLNRMSNLLLTLSGAQIGYAQAVADATKAIKTNGHTHDLATQKGRDNATALNQVATAANAQRDAMLKANDGNVKAAASATSSRASFVKLATQMGYSKAQAQALAAEYIKIPNVTRTAKLLADKADLDAKLAAAKKQLADPDLTRERKAKLNADIAALQSQLKKAQAAIDAMHGKNIPITYTFNGTNFALGTGPQATARGKGALATGGLITGPGTGTSDTAGLYALSNNEWVVKASSAQKYGGKAMASVNAGTATVIPGMATGGGINIHGTGVFKDDAQMRKILMGAFPAASSAPGGGAGVQKWAAVALAALAAAGDPASWLGSLLRRMNQESGGNPRAINLTDSNAKAGHPSQGLMQTIPGTFSAYAGPYASRGILDPFANIYAAIKYTVARYGSGPAGWDKSGGYKQGTPWVPNDQVAFLHKGEAVIPAHVNKRSDGVGGAVAAGMAQGMRSGGSAAIDAVGQVAMQMITKAKEVLGISSPSKAFAQIGLYVNQGFRIGLLGSAKSVQSAMSSLMSKVLNISFNAADTKKAIEKTITSLNASLAAARGRIKPVTGNAKHQAAAERGNRQAEASIRSIQAKLKSAYTDLANVASIAARLGTTVKRNAIIAMLQRENVAMQKLANARAKVAGQLKAAQSKLANAIQVRNDFKKQITDAAMSFNAITNIQPDANGQLTASGIIAQMTETLRKTQAFAANLARLKKSGLNATTYQQIAEAGVEQGGSIADALLAGGGNTFNSINRLQSNISSAAAGLGDTASKNLYQAGVDAAQGLVNGLLAKTKALDAASKKLANAIVAQIKKTLGIHSPSKVLQWHGSMAGRGFELGIKGEYGRVQRAAAGLGAAATPGPGRRQAVSSSAGRGGDIYITVNGALDPNAVALQIRQILNRYDRTGGRVVTA